ncbi:tetratricopeptide repeat protein [Undibacterium sp. Ji42W]|uniref:tetratricopeptide repeat protein n=1 Tax=Undibacterium sp. Ji42W TaxID=3413039 RepID=UPI003BF153B1
MDYTPSFFSLYGLPADADERAVKRVYAKHLKKIDQETDLPGFQALREAYEEAQAWIRHRDSGRLRQGDMPAQQGSDKGSQKQTLSPQSEAGAVSQEQVARNNAEPVRPLTPKEQVPDARTAEAKPLAVAAGQTERVTPGSAAPAMQEGDKQLAASKAERVFAEMLMAMLKCADEEAYAEKHLRLAMGDPRLSGNYARYVFETLLAAYLSRGWRRGNGELFDAAFEIFGWDKDKPRLLSLGRRGHLLDRAHKERQAFFQRPVNLRKAQWELLKKLRQDKNPGKDYLEANFKKLLVLHELYPVWLWMVTSKDNFNIWKAQFDAIQEVARENALKEAQEVEARNKVAQGSGGTFSVPGEDVGATARTSFYTAMRARSGPFRPYFLPVFLCAVALLIVQLIVQDAKTVTPPPVVRQTVPKTPAARFDAACRELSRAGKHEEMLQKAVLELAQLSTEGYVKASYQLGWLYRDGRQVKQDDAEALKWFTKAAEQAHLDAAVMVADYYFDGRGVNKNLDEAIRWYSKAAEQGQSLAQIKLAHLYADGTGVKKDRKRVLELMTAAAEKGQAVAQSELGLMYLNGLYGAYANAEKAAYWFLLSARQNDAIGQRMLGLINEKGLGGYTQDHLAASQWYGRAARQGDAEASKRLKSLCQSGFYMDCREN